jgi:hypothetical protein
MDYGGLRRAFHVGGDRKRLFSFQREMSRRVATFCREGKEKEKKAREL